MKSILVVDDQSICRELLAESLQNHGYDAICVADGAAALTHCASHVPDLILLDLMMPGMDGLSLLEKLRITLPRERVPVIVLTDDAKRASVLRARELGVQGYILKSHFSFSQMLERIQAVIERTQTVPEDTNVGARQPAGASAAVQRRGSSPITPMTREATLKRLQELSKLGTLPGSAAETIAIASSPYSSRADLAHVLNRDPVLATRVLRVANSSAYSVSRTRIHSVEQAISVIGFEEVRNLATAIGIFDALPHGDFKNALGAIRCWQHSLAVATLMDRTAPPTEEFSLGAPYLTGLCHDLGEIVLRQYFSSEYQSVVARTAETGQPFDDVEIEVFGVGHAELTSFVLAKLGLPEAITEPIRAFYGAPSARDEATVEPLGRALRIANLLAHGLLFASTTKVQVEPLRQADIENLGLRSIALDLERFRSEIMIATHMLAGISSKDEAKLAEPLIRRREARICYVRDASFSEFDPLGYALQLLSDVEFRATMPQDAEDRASFSGIVVAAAEESSEPGRDDEAAHRVLRLIDHAGGSGNSAGSAATKKMHPISLDELAKFVAEK